MLQISWKQKPAVIGQHHLRPVPNVILRTEKFRARKSSRLYFVYGLQIYSLISQIATDLS